jgi:hypothetical protein
MKCESCDIEITGVPLLSRERPYCCSGCAHGGPCVCSYDEQQRFLRKERATVLIGELLSRYESSEGLGGN